MQPQGQSLVNASYFQQLTADVQSINGCAALQQLANEAMATAQAEVTAIEAQIAALAPLIVLPTNLGSVITWIENFAAHYLLPYQNYITQLAQTVQQIQALTAAIEAAAASFQHCTVTVPPLQLST